MLIVRRKLNPVEGDPAWTEPGDYEYWDKDEKIMAATSVHRWCLVWKLRWAKMQYQIQPLNRCGAVLEKNRHVFLILE